MRSSAKCQVCSVPAIRRSVVACADVAHVDSKVRRAAKRPPMFHRSVATATLAILFFACACSHSAAPATGSGPRPILTDPWLRRAPLTLAIPDYPTQALFVVLEDEQIDAQRRLEHVAWVRLTDAEAKVLVGRDVSSAAGTSAPYLLRCIRPEGNGLRGEAPVVKEAAGNVFVFYGAGRSRMVEGRHLAIVALLSSEPKDVYVDAQVAIH